MHDEIIRHLKQPVASYAEAKARSEELDALIGIRTAAIETSLQRTSGPEQELWIDLPVQTLLTPYSELVEVVDKIDPPAGSLWIDLGAGYGRLGIVLGCLRPETRFVGYEIVDERTREGQAALARLGLSNARLVTQDLADPGFKPEAADFYFLYDYGSRAAVEKTLDDLREIAASRPITVVARGRGARHWTLRGQPWLSQVIAPQHFDHYSIFRSA